MWIWSRRDDQLGSLAQGPVTFWVGQKLILDPYFVSAYMVFLKRGLPRRLGKECKSVQPCALTWWRRDPVMCLYMCMCVNHLSCMSQVTTHEVMLQHDIQ